jgi:glycosyltransferase involved in cell wall biosynthesis
LSSNHAIVEKPLSSDRAATKRILFLGFSSQPGGAELQMFSLIDKLDRARFEAVIALAEDGPLSKMLLERSHKVVIVPSMGALLRGVPDLRTVFARAATLLPTVLALRRLIFDHSIDLIHAYAQPAIKYAAVLKLITERPTLCTFLEAKLPRRNWLHPAGLVAALNYGVDQILSPSHSAATSLVEARVAAKRVTVVHHGVDVARFSTTEEIRAIARRQIGVFNDDPVVAMSARFTRMKGHDVLLRAIALLASRGRLIRTIICGMPLFEGEREWHDAICRLLIDLRLENSVTLTGWLDDVVPLYAASDIVVHPCTLPDTLPLAVLEAMAAGRPVVASDIGGLPELVENDRTGLLVRPGDHNALANAILELVDQPEKAKRLGSNARRRAVEEFDESRYAAAIMNVYDQHLRCAESYGLRR